MASCKLSGAEGSEKRIAGFQPLKMLFGESRSAVALRIPVGSSWLCEECKALAALCLVFLSLDFGKQP